MLCVIEFVINGISGRHVSGITVFSRVCACFDADVISPATGRDTLGTGEYALDVCFRVTTRHHHIVGYVQFLAFFFLTRYSLTTTDGAAAIRFTSLAVITCNGDDRSACDGYIATTTSFIVIRVFSAANACAVAVSHSQDFTTANVDGDAVADFTTADARSIHVAPCSYLATIDVYGAVSIIRSIATTDTSATFAACSSDRAIIDVHGAGIGTKTILSCGIKTTAYTCSFLTTLNGERTAIDIYIAARPTIK